VKRQLLLIVSIAILFGVDRGFGQASPLNFERVAPKPLMPLPHRATLPATENQEVSDDTPVIDKVKGIVLLSEASAVRPGGRSGVTGVIGEGDIMLGNPKLHARLAKFVGKAANFGELQGMCAEIVRFYRENRRPVVDAQLPEQDVTGGVLQIVVVEGHVGKILAENQRWFPEKRLLGAVRSRPGEAIDSSQLLDDLNWINRNPFRRSDVLFKKGEAPGETDLVIKTTDRFPFRPYIAYDNWGTELTDTNRLQAGFNWGNAFWLDQIVSYQFTMAPDPHVFTAHAAVWTIPLPWRHVLEFYGSTARSRPENVDVDVDAKSTQLGLLYTIPLPNFHGIKHDLALGAEFKRSNNNLLFGGTSIFNSDTEIVQARLSYQARQVDGSGATTLQASAFYSPGDLTSNNNDEAFAGERAFAEAEYFYGRLTLQRTQTLPWKLSLVGTIGGQLASGNLLASEQLSLGGASTIRGYEEGALNGDRGWFGSIELYSPPTILLNRLRPGKFEEELKLLAFVDFGGVSNIDLLPGEDGYMGAAGAGVGVRYRVNTRVSVRFDYAWRLQAIDAVSTDPSRAYLSVTVSY
jgi:hemolysin activation/secretion protein